MSTSTNNKSTISEKLEKLNNEMRDKIARIIPLNTELERIEYNAPSDDEIVSAAKSTLEQKYATSTQSTKDGFDTKKASLSESIEKALKDAGETESKAVKQYKGAQDNIENQVLKRGLARSSVAVGELGELERLKQEDLKSIRNNSDETINKINNEISGLETQLSEALKKMDMQYAIELDEKISKLKAERETKQQEAIKYNNTLIEKEYKMDRSKEQAEYDKNVADIEYSYSVKKLATVLNHFLAYEDPDLALKDFLADESLIDTLGSDHIYVYNAIKAK